MKKLFSIMLVLSAPLTLAAEYSEEDLSTAYNNYQAAIEAQDFDDALSRAREAYDIGLALVPDTETMSALAINYGNLMVNPGLVGFTPDQGRELRQSPEAREAFELALAIGEDVYGDDALELIDTLLSLARTYSIEEMRDSSGPENVTTLLDRSADIAAQHMGGQQGEGDINLEAGEILLQLFPAPQALSYLETAQSVYAGMDGAAPLQVRASSATAYYYYARQDLDQAETVALDTLALAEEQGVQTGSVLQMHNLLEQIYTLQEMPDKAEQQRQAAADMQG